MFSRVIEYKGIDFNVMVENQDIKIEAKYYPIVVNGVYSLDEPIMDRVYKILDENNVEKLAERYEEFIGTP